MSSIPYFDQKMITNNYPQLERFLKVEESLTTLKTQYKQSNSADTPFSHMKVVWIVVIAPFEKLIAVVFRALAHLTSYIDRKLSLICLVISAQMTRDWDQLCKWWKLGPKLLVPTIYCPQLGTSDAYAQKTCPLQDTVLDKKIGKAYTLPKGSDDKDHNTRAKRYEEEIKLKQERAKTTLNFFPEKGFSEGASIFFIYMTLNTDSYKDKEKQLRYVAESFKTGFPRQVPILQAFQAGQREEFLQLKKEECKECEEILTYFLDHQPQTAKTQLAQLTPGTYQLNIFHHSLIYVKTDKQGYVFDLNFGLLKMTSDELLEWILEHYHQKEEFGSKITIYKYSKK